jgi:hypothetical protein
MSRKVFKVDKERAKQSKQRLEEESQRSGLPMWKIPQGSTRIRILPPWSEAGDIAFECRSHWKVPPNDTMYNCLKVINKECPICEFAYKLKLAGNKELASSLYPSKSVYYNIVVRGEEDKGVQVMRSGILLYENILSYLYDEDYGDITDIDNGRDMIIERVGTTKEDTKYTLKPAANTSPLHSDKAVVDKWIDNMFDLDKDIATFRDPLELQAVINNIHGTKSETVVSEVENLIEAPVTVEEDKEDSEDNSKENLLKEIESLIS